MIWRRSDFVSYPIHWRWDSMSGLSIVEQKYHLQNLSGMALSTRVVASTCLQHINLIINIVVLPMLLLPHTYFSLLWSVWYYYTVSGRKLIELVCNGTSHFAIGYRRRSTSTSRWDWQKTYHNLPCTASSSSSSPPPPSILTYHHDGFQMPKHCSIREEEEAHNFCGKLHGLTWLGDWTRRTCFTAMRVEDLVADDVP